MFKPTIKLEALIMVTRYTQSEKILSALSYFSVFFAPVIFPVIVWILADKPVSTHAKKSLLFHLLPYILIVISSVILGTTGSVTNQFLYVILMILAALGAFLAIYFVIYNLLCGIKILLKDNL